MTLGDDCVTYFTCFEYGIGTRTLRVYTCTNQELGRLVKRKKVREIKDTYTRETVVNFMKDELIRKGEVVNASLLATMTNDNLTSDVKVYYNSSSLIVAAEIFVTASCF
ncbi:hypothetical protein [Thermococcus sp.]